jgi:hypothetical protein
MGYPRILSFSFSFLTIGVSVLMLAQSKPRQIGDQPTGIGPTAPRLPRGESFTQGKTPASKPTTPNSGTTQASGLNFAPAVAYDSGGLTAWSVAVADVNGDGKPDLLLANQCVSYGDCPSGTGGVLLGNGDGTFQTAFAYGSGDNAVSVAVADVNGDRKPDLIFAGRNGLVGVVLGNGDGTFQPAVSYDSNGLWSYSVSVADLNGDGNPDIVAENGCYALGGGMPSGLGVGVLLGNGDGTFQSVTSYDSVGDCAFSVAIADVNGDGKPDIVVTNANPNSNTVGVLLGNGDGTFQPAVTYGSGGFEPVSVVIADVNGDGYLDLVVANNCQSVDSIFWGDCTGSGVVGVLLGNGDGTFQAAVPYGSGGWEAYSVSVADLNGDGNPDIAVANEGSNTVGVLLGNGDGTFQPAVTYGSGGIYPDFVAAADVNGDGKPDLLVVNNNAIDSCVPSGSCYLSSVGVLINSTMNPTGVAGGAILSTTDVEFGVQELGTTSGSKTVKLKNKSSAALNISGIAVGGDFALVNTANQCPSSGSVAPKSS